MQQVASEDAQAIGSHVLVSGKIRVAKLLLDRANWRWLLDDRLLGYSSSIEEIFAFYALTRILVCL